jgi:hypothetical protein
MNSSIFRLRYAAVFALLVAFAVTLVLRAALAHAEDAGAARVAAEYAAAAAPGGDELAPTAATPPPPPAPSVSDVVELVRAGKLPTAVAVLVYLVLGAALRWWPAVVEIVPWLGRGRWQALVAGGLGVATSLVAAAATADLTADQVLWPLLIGVVMAWLPGPRAQESTT